MDDSAVISVHWWVTMALLCMLALNSREKVKEKKKGEVFLWGEAEEIKKGSASTSKILPLWQNQYDKYLSIDRKLNLRMSIYFPKY